MLALKDNINFKGVPIADVKVKGINSCYRLYKINKQDDTFLYQLRNSIDLKKLMPNLNEDEYMCWGGIIEESILHANFSKRESLLETCDNKPCGIINFSKSSFDSYYLDYIVTFPIEVGKRVKCAGQILLNYLFQTVLDTNNNGIDLLALKYTPFNPISVYSKLGFWFDGGDNYTEDMSIGREGIKNALKKQKEFLDVTPIKKTKNINLGNVINLNT